MCERGEERDRAKSLSYKGCPIIIFFFLPIYLSMKVQEMTVWWILCGVLVVVGSLGAEVEGESRVVAVVFWIWWFDLFPLFLLQPRISRYWWISIIDWMTMDYWCGIRVQTCVGKKEFPATGTVGLRICKFDIRSASQAGWLMIPLPCRRLDATGMKGTLPAEFAQLSEVTWL